MAKKDTKKKEFETRIDKAGIDNIESVIQDIEASEELEADVRAELLDDAGSRRNELEIQYKKSQEKIEEANEAASEDAKIQSAPRKKLTFPGTKTIEYRSEEELKKYESEGLLVRCIPSAVGRGIATIKIAALALLFALIFAPSGMAAREAALGGQNSDGSYRFTIEDGDLIPGIDGTHDIGSATKRVSELHADSIVLPNCTIAADDATPDVTGCTVLTTSANTGATAITDLDNPVPGKVYTIIGGSATNSTTIADSGNFNLSASYTAAVDDVLQLYVVADNDYIEVGRVNN